MQDITIITASKMPSRPQWVRSLRITFIPITDEMAVMGKVTAAITASRSAAMVIFVSVLAR